MRAFSNGCNGCVAGTKVPALIERGGCTRPKNGAPGVAGTKVPALIERRDYFNSLSGEAPVLPELKFRPSLSALQPARG